MTDIFQKRRLGQITIVLLVLLNLALILTMIISKPPRRGNETPQQGLEGFLREELQLSEEQMQAFVDIRNGHFNTLKPKMEALSDSMEILVDAAFDPDVDSLDVAELTKSMAVIHTEMDLALYRHFAHLNEICSPEQQVLLRKLADQLIRGSTQPPPPERQSMSGRPPHGEERGRGPGGPPPRGKGPGPGGPPPRNR